MKHKELTSDEVLYNICRMIANGGVSKPVYNLYLSEAPIGFMSADEMYKYLKEER